MASIRRRGDRQWFAEVRRNGYPSQRKTFSTKAAAETWAREIEFEMDGGQFADRGSAKGLSLGDALRRYLSEVTPTKRSAKKEKNRILQILRLPLMERTFASLMPSDFAAYRDERAKSVRSSSIRNELYLLSNLYVVASREWDMPFLKNPVRSVRKPPPDPARDRRLKPGEFDKLIEASAGYTHLIQIIEIAIETAMRQSEIVGLQWADVDLDAGKAQLRKTKNGKPRVVPLTLRARAIIKSVQKFDESRVFAPSAGYVSLAFGRICKRAGIIDLTFHDLRHEATSRLIEKGLNVMEVMAITGHQDMSMLKRYTHLRTEDLVKKIG